MLSTVGALAMNVSTGRLINDIGLGILLLIGCLISGLGYLGYALAPTWWILVAFGFVTAVGSTGLIAGLNTFFAINQTPRLMIWLQACFGLGAIVSPSVVAALLSNHYSWRWAYGLVVLLMVGLALGFFLTVKSWRMAQPEVGNSPRRLDTAAADPADSSDDWENGPVRKTGSTAALRMPAVWLSLLLFFVLTGVESSTAQWPYTLFTEARDIDPRVAGLWVSLFWASLTLGRIFFGFVVERVGTVTLVRLTMAGVVCGAALLWWNIANTLSFLGFTLIGFAVSPLFPVLASNTPERIGAQYAADVMGFQLASVRLGLAAVPALMGVLAAARGLEIIGPSLFIVAVAMFLIHEASISGWTVSKITNA
jgi:fucose permease